MIHSGFYEISFCQRKYSYQVFWYWERKVDMHKKKSANQKGNIMKHPDVEERASNRLRIGQTDSYPGRVQDHNPCPLLAPFLGGENTYFTRLSRTLQKTVHPNALLAGVLFCFSTCTEESPRKHLKMRIPNALSENPWGWGPETTGKCL